MLFWRVLARDIWNKPSLNDFISPGRVQEKRQFSNETICMNLIQGLRHSRDLGPYLVKKTVEDSGHSRENPAIKTGINIFFFRDSKVCDKTLSSTPTCFLVALIAWRNARFDPEGKKKKKMIADFDCGSRLMYEKAF